MSTDFFKLSYTSQERQFNIIYNKLLNKTNNYYKTCEKRTNSCFEKQPATVSGELVVKMCTVWQQCILSQLQYA